MTIRAVLAACACCALAVLAACNDDDCPDCPDCPTCPGDPAATMANIWPHADGNAWTYEGTYAEYDLDAPALEAPIPSMTALHEALAETPPGTPTDSTAALYRLALDGEVTTESGVTAQNLTGTFYLPVPGRMAATGPDRLLRLVARARPDLRPAILDRIGPAPKELTAVTPPFFLGGYAFAYEDSGYYGYGDVDTGHSWVYLEESLAAGTEFSLQLVPALADDVWLHGRIWAQGDRTVGGRTYRDVIECLYVVDLGEQVVTDEGGGVIGTYYPYMAAVSWYAPEVGPIAGRERHVLAGDGIAAPTGPQIIDYVLDLAGATTAP